MKPRLPCPYEPEPPPAVEGARIKLDGRLASGPVVLETRNR